MAGAPTVASVPATPHRPRCHRRGASPGFGECNHRTPRGASGQPLTRWRPGDRRWMACLPPFPPLPQMPAAASLADGLRVCPHPSAVRLPIGHCPWVTPRRSLSARFRPGPAEAPLPSASRQTRRAGGPRGYPSAAGGGSLG